MDAETVELVQRLHAYAKSEGWDIFDEAAASITAAALESLAADRARLQEALLKEREVRRELVRECLASDFNEHWDSYKAARKLDEENPR